jgi:3-isopropylmalate/(R)-2-methylmalate dehydratase large subunit
MAQTIAEKILSAHAGRDLRAGDFAVVKVDFAYVQDGTGPLTVRQLAALGAQKLFDPGRSAVFLDHASPSPRQELSNDHKFLRDFCRRTGAILSEIGCGISHTVVAESYVCPGDVIVGADSHTCTTGAHGAFSTGMGSTDVAVAWAFGRTWMRVPESYRVVGSGPWPKGVYAKDFMLNFIGSIRADGANYKALEFVGEALAALSMAGRMTISNMAVEAGAKVGIFPSDETTRRYLERQGRGRCWRPVRADEGARYERVLEFDVSKLVPMVAKPHFVDNVCPLGDLKEEVRADQVFLGTSTAGRLEDFQQAARILKGRRVAPGTRLLATPGSRQVLLEGMADGTFPAILEAGGVLTTPGCGACVGVHEGVLADGEVCVSTQNRNFQGRMGNPRAFIYLVSPATAAATAVAGRLTDPREFL